jgi:hypothetical protein
MSLLNINDVNWDVFSIGKSGRSLKLLYNKAPFQFCTCLLYTPFGVKSTQKDWSKYDDYYLDCSINQSNSEESVKLRDFLDKLDETIKKLVKENCELFNITKDNLNFGYNNILRENKNYPKLMKLQLPRDKNGNFDCFIFNNDKSKIKINESNIEEILVKGKIFKCIIECSKLWYFKEKVGSMWQIDQLKFVDIKMTDTTTNNIGTVEQMYNTCIIEE